MKYVAWAGFGACALLPVACDTSSPASAVPMREKPAHAMRWGRFVDGGASSRALLSLPVSFRELREGASVSIAWDGYGSKDCRRFAEGLAELLRRSGYVVVDNGSSTDFTLFISRVHSESEASLRGDGDVASRYCAETTLYDNSRQGVMAYNREARPDVYGTRLWLTEAEPRLFWSEGDALNADVAGEARARLIGLFQKLASGMPSSHSVINPTERVLVLYCDEGGAVVRRLRFASNGESPWARRLLARIKRGGDVALVDALERADIALVIGMPKGGRSSSGALEVTRDLVLQDRKTGLRLTATLTQGLRVEEKAP